VQPAIGAFQPAEPQDLMSFSKMTRSQIAACGIPPDAAGHRPAG